MRSRHKLLGHYKQYSGPDVFLSTESAMGTQGGSPLIISHDALQVIIVRVAQQVHA